MRFEWDPEKNRTNVRKHGIDFEDAKDLLAGPTIEMSEERKSEQRTVAYGYLKGHPTVLVYVIRSGEVCRLISARSATKAEEQEMMRLLGMERRAQRRDRMRGRLRERKENKDG